MYCGKSRKTSVRTAGVPIEVRGVAPPPRTQPRSYPLGPRAQRLDTQSVCAERKKHALTSGEQSREDNFAYRWGPRLASFRSRLISCVYSRDCSNQRQARCEHLQTAYHAKCVGVRPLDTQTVSRSLQIRVLGDALRCVAVWQMFTKRSYEPATSIFRVEEGAMREKLYG
jgi:hypothetical protein